MINLIYGIIKAIPAARDLFFGVQDLYYNDLFEDLSTEANDYKGRRRAISNSIEAANTNDDLRHLSLMLAELQTTRHRESAGPTSDSPISDK